MSNRFEWLVYTSGKLLFFLNSSCRRPLKSKTDWSILYVLQGKMQNMRLWLPEGSLLSVRRTGVASLYRRRAAKYRILAARGLLSVKRTGVACLYVRIAVNIRL